MPLTQAASICHSASSCDSQCLPPPWNGSPPAVRASGCISSRLAAGSPGRPVATPTRSSSAPARRSSSVAPSAERLQRKAAAGARVWHWMQRTRPARLAVKIGWTRALNSRSRAVRAAAAAPPAAGVAARTQPPAPATPDRPAVFQNLPPLWLGSPPADGSSGCTSSGSSADRPRPSARRGGEVLPRLLGRPRLPAPAAPRASAAWRCPSGTRRRTPAGRAVALAAGRSARSGPGRPRNRAEAAVVVAAGRPRPTQRASVCHSGSRPSTPSACRRRGTGRRRRRAPADASAAGWPRDCRARRAAAPNRSSSATVPRSKIVVPSTGGMVSSPPVPPPRPWHCTHRTSPSRLADEHRLDCGSEHLVVQAGGGRRGRRLRRRAESAGRREHQRIGRQCHAHHRQGADNRSWREASRSSEAEPGAELELAREAAAAQRRRHQEVAGTRGRR